MIINRVYHSKDEFVRGKSHINGIESFWNYAKRRMSKSNGLTNHKFNLHWKECELGWNVRAKIKLYNLLLKDFRSRPLTILDPTLIAIPYNPCAPKVHSRWTMAGMLDLDYELKVAEEF